MKIEEACFARVCDKPEAGKKSAIMNWLRFLFASFIFAMISFSCKKNSPCGNCQITAEPPIAIAGKDQVTTLRADSALLDGSASNDPDGTINKWHWIKISGPSSVNIINPDSPKTEVKNMVSGLYQFELTVTDNKGLSAKDTMNVTVDSLPPAGHRPVADAGVDQIIILPANTTILDGSRSADSDNNITSYLWTKISGPSSYQLATANAAVTAVNSLVEGVYQFELKVTDAGGSSDKDTMMVTVNKQQPACTDCKIVFVSDRDGNPEIYSCNADGSGIRRLTNDPGIDEQPAWSADGKRIAFKSNRSGSFEIYIMNADGSNVVQRTFNGSNSAQPCWSPDGTRIAFSVLGNSGDARIWMVGATDGSPSLLFEQEGSERQPAWSPDGTAIAMACELIGYAYHYNIYTIKPDGTGFTGRPLINIGDYFEFIDPSWSPDGKKLAITFTHPRSLESGITKVGVTNADGSGLTVIASRAGVLGGTTWSADGSRIAYALLSGSRNDILWISADGSSSGTLVTNGWGANWKH